MLIAEWYRLNLAGLGFLIFMAVATTILAIVLRKLEK